VPTKLFEKEISALTARNMIAWGASPRKKDAAKRVPTQTLDETVHFFPENA
jgi:hypothetical protein